MEEEVAVPPPPGADEIGRPELPPLENPTVLKRLFELIPFELEEFRNIRLVSRAWHDESLSTWRKNAWLTLHDSNADKTSGDENVEDGEAEVLPGIISRQKYLDLLENEQLQLVEYPFLKYSLRRWKIKLQSLNRDGEKDQVRFWNRVGPLITHLKLSHSNFAKVTDFRSVIFDATSNLQSLKLVKNVYNVDRPAAKEQRLDPKLPQHAVIPVEQVQNNLVELEMHWFDDEDDQGDEDSDEYEPLTLVGTFPITWMELIIHFPNIKKLGKMKLRATAIADLLEFFESAEILRKERGPVYLSQLADLDLMLFEEYGIRSSRGTLFSTINRLHLPLKRLAFVIDSTVDEETFKQLLQHPLEYLNVHREHDEHNIPFRNFPFGLKMALNELSIRGLIAPNLVFLRECPNLERFTYSPEDGYETNLTQGLIDGNPPTKLEKLTDLSFYCNELGAEEIRKLGVLIPNVRNLHIGLDDGSFRAVCEIWKDLEHLTISPWRIGEKAFLGKDEHSGEKFHHPNITDLKNLKQFTMYGGQQVLTDGMILDGLLALPNLEQLSSICLSSQVSPYVHRQLNSKFPECIVFIQNEEPAGGNEYAAAAAEFQQN